jgi:hypothetical protein
MNDGTKNFFRKKLVEYHNKRLIFDKDKRSEDAKALTDFEEQFFNEVQGYALNLNARELLGMWDALGRLFKAMNQEEPKPQACLDWDEVESFLEEEYGSLGKNIFEKLEQLVL